MRIKVSKIIQAILTIFVVFSAVGFAYPLFASPPAAGTFLGGNISTITTANTYAIADTDYLQGGHMQLDNTAAMRSITPERRSVGMLVTVLNTSSPTATGINGLTTYRLISNPGGATCPSSASDNSTTPSQTVTNSSLDGLTNSSASHPTYPCSYTQMSNWAVAIPAISSSNIGQFLTTSDGANFSWAAVGTGGGGGSGTVTSVSLTLPSIFNVSGSPVTSSGTLSASLATQAANSVFAGPGSGSAASPTFRSLVNADLPSDVVFNALNSGQILVGNVSNVATPVTLTGDATIDNTGLLTIANNAITTAKINNGAVTYAKLQNESTVTILGNPTATGAAPSEITLGAGLSFSGSTLTATGSGGTVTSVAASGGTTGLSFGGSPITTSGTLTLSGTLAIANGGTGQVTANAAFNALAPSQTGNSGKVLSTDGTNTSWASVLTTTLTSGNIIVGNVSNVATSVALSGDATISNTGVLTIANNAITTAKINNAAVTYAKLQNESTGTLLGNPTATGATPSEITLGSGLSFTGSTLGVANLPGATWTMRTTPGSSSWQSVAYGNGEYVAVANDGTTSSDIMTSPDGFSWTNQTSPVANAWDAVTYGNGLFAAVATTATSTDVMTSPDGVNWTGRAGAATNAWKSIAYGAGKFVAVANNGSTSNDVMTSPDGITWTPRNVPTANAWDSVTYGNGKFVAVSTNGTTSNNVMYSTDGITWSSASVSSAAAITWTGVTYGAGKYVAVSNGGTLATDLMYSTNATTWTSATSPGTTANFWTAVTYGNGLFAAVAGNDSASNDVITSPDGITWTSRAPTAAHLTGIVASNGVFVAISQDGSPQVETSGLPAAAPVQNNNIYQGGITITGTANITSLSTGLVQSNVNGTLSSLTAPTSTQLLAYDATDAANEYLTIGTGLSYSHSTHTLSSTGGGGGLTIGSAVGSGTANEILFADASGNLAQSANLAFTSGTNPIFKVGDIAAAGHGNQFTLNDSTQLATLVAKTGFTITSGDFILKDPTSGSDSIEVNGSHGLKLGDTDGVWSNAKIIIDQDGDDISTFGGSMEDYTDNYQLLSSGDKSIYINAGAATYQFGDIDGYSSPTYLGLNSSTGAFNIYGEGLNDLSLNPATQIYTLGISGGTNLTVNNSTGVVEVHGNESISAFSGTAGVIVVDSTGELEDVGMGTTGQVLTMDGSGNATWATPTGGSSTPGSLWIDQVNPVARQWRSIAYGDGKFVAVASDGSTSDDVMVSTDGTHWTNDGLTGVPSTHQWQSVTYGDGKFVAVASDGTTSNDVMYSTDGLTWSNSGISGVPAANAWDGIAYGDGIFVAVAANGTTSNDVMWSSDGVTWSHSGISGVPAARHWNSIAFGQIDEDAKFVAVASDGTTSDDVMVSLGGTSWGAASSIPNASAWTSVAFGNGQFVAVAAGGTTGNDVIYSNDEGSTWTAGTGAAAINWNAVTYGDGKYVAVGSDVGDPTNTSDIMTSTDAITWTIETSPIARSWASVTYGGGGFAAVADDGTTSDQVMTSSSSGGGGGSLTIGTPIGSGTANQILFADGSGNLAQSENLQFTNGANPRFFVGDNGLSGNGDSFSITDSTGVISLTSDVNAVKNATVFQFSSAVGGGGDTLVMGDVNGVGNGTTFQLGDVNANAILTTNNGFLDQNESGSQFLNLNPSSGSYGIGDISDAGHDTQLFLDDAHQEATVIADSGFNYRDSSDNSYLYANVHDHYYGIGSVADSTGVFINGNNHYTGVNTLYPTAALDILSTNSGASAATTFAGTGANDLTADLSAYTGALYDDDSQLVVTGARVQIVTGDSFTTGDTVEDDSTGATGTAETSGGPVVVITYTSSGNAFRPGDSITDVDASFTATMSEVSDIFTDYESIGGSPTTFNASTTPQSIGTQGIMVSFLSTSGHFAGDNFDIIGKEGNILGATAANGAHTFDIDNGGGIHASSNIDNTLYGGSGYTSGAILSLDPNEGVYAFGDLGNTNQGEKFVISDGGPTGTDWSMHLVDDLGQYFVNAPSGGSYAWGDISDAYGGTAIHLQDASGTILAEADNEFDVEDNSGNHSLFLSPSTGQYGIGDTDASSNSTAITLDDTAETVTATAAQGFFVKDVDGNPYLEIAPTHQVYSIGDLAATNNGTNLSVDDGGSSIIGTVNKGFDVRDTDGNHYFDVDVQDDTYALGDVSDVLNGTTLGINDSLQSVSVTANHLFNVGDTSGNSFFSINPAAATYSIGDLSSVGNSTTLVLDDTDHEIDISGNVYVTGTVSTCVLGNATGGVTCTSDARLKTNVNNLPSELSNIDSLRPVTFKWIDPTKDQGVQMGLIAQEVQQIYPQFVHDVGNGYIGIDYASLVVPAIKAIQELDIKIEPLTSLDLSDDNSLASLIRQYVENAMNGIGTLFAGKVQTNELCLQDVCVTKAQLQQLLNQANVNAAPSDSTATSPDSGTTTGGGDSTATAPDSGTSGSDTTATPADGGSDSTATAPAIDPANTTTPADPTAAAPATGSGSSSSSGSSDPTASAPAAAPASADSGASAPATTTPAAPSDPSASAPAGS